MALNRGAHTQSRLNQCDQANQRQKSRRAIERARQLRVCFGVVRDARAPAEYAAEFFFRRFQIVVRPKLQEKQFCNAAAGNDDTGSGEIVSSNTKEWSREYTAVPCIELNCI